MPSKYLCMTLLLDSYAIIIIIIRGLVEFDVGYRLFEKWLPNRPRGSKGEKFAQTSRGRDAMTYKRKKIKSITSVTPTLVKVTLGTLDSDRETLLPT